MTTPTITKRREATKPILIAWAVSGEGRNEFWTRIGATFKHDHGDGQTTMLNAYPINARIVHLPPKEEAEHAPEQA